MKFLSIITILLVLIIAIAQAIPATKRKAGSKVIPLGVSFEDSYQLINTQSKNATSKFEKRIASFKTEIPKAAKEDQTDKKTVKWLLSWNEKYEKLVDELGVTNKKLDASIAKLHKKLKALKE
ncbi:16975_t:CDS:1 [Funneliformis caledonium]|uniref:16975_t:CDS:1 n=1 Tax=Funneliformis caledonium TaxID=1117310 RepID=A0A9N8YP89_9GLOM|nr:16975_t:CDS:1 [Funneliformis caledonium]